MFKINKKLELFVIMREKLTLVVAFLMLLTLTQAQVGVGTDEPKATLHVVGTPDNASIPDGIIAPIVTGNQLHAKQYGAEQTGAIIYVSEAPSSVNQEGQTVDVATSGYYFFNGTKWVTFSTGSVWFKAGTNKPAINNADNVYVLGNVGVGIKNPTKALDVNGELKLRTMAETQDNDTQVTVGQDGVLRKSIYPIYKKNTIAGRFENGVNDFVSETKRVGAIEFRLKGHADQVKVEMRFVDPNMPTQKCHIQGKRTILDSWVGVREVSSLDFSHVFQFNYELDFGGYANIIFEHGMCYRVDFHAWRYVASGWVPYNVTITELSGRGNW